MVKVLVIQSQTVTLLSSRTLPSQTSPFSVSFAHGLNAVHYLISAKPFHLFSLSLSVHSLCRLKSWPLKPGTFLIRVFCKQLPIMNVCINGTEKIQVVRKICIQHSTKRVYTFWGFRMFLTLGFLQHACLISDTMNYSFGLQLWITVLFFLSKPKKRKYQFLGVCLSFVFHEYDTMISLIVVPLAEVISFLGIIYLFF